MRFAWLMAAWLVCHCSIVGSAQGAALSPRPLVTPAPDYPAEAKAAGREGTVEVVLTVMKDGTVGLVRLGRSSGSEDLDVAALDAVKKWTFQPPTNKAGEPTEATVMVPLAFALEKAKNAIPETQQEWAAFWKRPCRDITAELAEFRSRNPGKKVDEAPSLRATKGYLSLVMLEHSMEGVLALGKMMPKILEAVERRCDENPDHPYLKAVLASFQETLPKKGSVAER